MMYKGYKVRLFPTPEQEELLWNHIHACRFVWNYMIEIQQKRYTNNEKHLKYFDMCKILKDVTKDNDWLDGINNGSLKIVCKNLEETYEKFFNKRCRYPKYKSKKNQKQMYPVRCDVDRFYIKNQAAKISNIGHIKISKKYDKAIDNIKNFYNVNISHINNKWILSFSLELDNQEQQLNDFSMGIDLGIKELAVVAVGDQKIVYHNINKSKRIKMLEQKRKHIQKCIDRKYRTNGNYEKTNAIIKYEKMQKEIYYKLANIRRNYIHQVTHELVSMLPKRVIMEDLNILGMMKNKNLSKALAEQCLYEFIRQMKYKCEWAGIEFVQADRFYPSSKTCSRCGEIKKDLKLSDRVYKCSCCGLEIDRDYNAAINLMKYESQTERLSA